MGKFNKVILGILLILIGIVFGGNALQLTNINVFFDGWWTLLIIIPSIVGLFDKKSNKTNNFIGLAIGIGFLLISREVINMDLFANLIIPFIFIVIGLSLIFNSLVKGKITKKIQGFNNLNFESVVAVFSEQKISADQQIFKDSKLDAVFGSIELDLRKAKIPNDIVIKSSSIFGGVKILVPDNLNVKIKSTPIFGEIKNKVESKSENKQTIYLEAFCLFGGFEIK